MKFSVSKVDETLGNFIFKKKETKTQQNNQHKQEVNTIFFQNQKNNQSAKQNYEKKTRMTHKSLDTLKLPYILTSM